MQEGIMKTGNTAEQTGLYSCECCDIEAVFGKGDTLPRCPRCKSLTVWDFTGESVTKAA
jgi:uncharacterized paraquat-inducible protein A